MREFFIRIIRKLLIPSRRSEHQEKWERLSREKKWIEKADRKDLKKYLKFGTLPAHVHDKRKRKDGNP